MGFKCRPGCGACCIAISISTPLPGLPDGKPAGQPCPHLTASFLCSLYDSQLRPQVCRDLQPLPQMCGLDREEALAYLTELERLTYPFKP